MIDPLECAGLFRVRVSCELSPYFAQAIDDFRQQKDILSGAKYRTEVDNNATRTTLGPLQDGTVVRGDALSFLVSQTVLNASMYASMQRNKFNGGWAIENTPIDDHVGISGSRLSETKTRTKTKTK